MRRRLIAGAAAGLGLLLTAPLALAQDSIPSSYAGSRITTPAAVASSSPSITAQIIRAYNPGVPGTSLTVQTFFTTPGGLPSGCPAAGEVELTTAVKPGDKPNSTDSAAVASAPCNGAYSFRVVATLRRPLSPNDVATLRGTVKVVAPPPDVTGASGKLEGSTVVLTWPGVSPRPIDFTGYKVERQDLSGKYVSLATLGTTATTFTDTSPPPEGGEVTYRILATRKGAEGADITSDGGGRVTVNLPVTTSTTTPAGTDGATDGGTAGTAGTGGTAGAGGTAGTSGTTDTTTKPTRTGTVRGRTGIGTRAPRLGTPTQGASGLLIQPDEGFDEELDYTDGALPGGEAEDDLSLFYEEDSGRGLAVPIGIGAVLAGWGMHLFFLARAARPTRIPVDPYGYPVDDYGY